MAMQLGEATIQTGASGAEVKRIQQILTGQGYAVGPIDGLYGPQTQAAVQAFQKTKGLVPDGIVGPLTWSALQGQPVAPAPMPGTVVASSPGIGNLGMMALYGIGALVVLALVSKSR